MGHNLNYNEMTGRYSFFSVKEKAWHNLGQVVTDYPTSAEAIQHAGLDYEVVKSPLFTNRTETLQATADLKTGEPVTVPKYFANVPSDNNTDYGGVCIHYLYV